MRQAVTLRVWDRFVRGVHGLLVIALVGAYLSTRSVGWLHQAFGLAALALVMARVGWGFVGSPFARFSGFVPGPRRLAHYLVALAHQREPRYLGHNPLGAVLALLLLALVGAICLTGWLMTLGTLWGHGTLTALHRLAVDATIATLVVHVAASLYASLRHRENLLRAIVTGDKRAVDLEPSATRHPEFAPTRPQQLS